MDQANVCVWVCVSMDDTHAIRVSSSRHFLKYPKLIHITCADDYKHTQHIHVHVRIKR